MQCEIKFSAEVRPEIKVRRCKTRIRRTQRAEGCAKGDIYPLFAQGMDNDKSAESDGKRGCLSLPLSARIRAISKAKERSRKRKPKRGAIVAGIELVEQGQFEQGEI